MKWPLLQLVKGIELRPLLFSNLGNRILVLFFFFFPRNEPFFDYVKYEMSMETCYIEIV